jgi:hypothetical protein
MQPAGTTQHARTVARRAEEAFSPVQQIANLGAAVMRAPLQRLPPPVHTQSAGEVAATEGLDFAHGSSFTMATLTTNVPGPPFRLVRADVEVDQDATGAIVSTRMVRRSGVAGFDEAAVRAIREALAMVQGPRIEQGRRSQWSFEVSNAAGAAASAAGFGNEGWQVLPDASNGVRLRMRVRMTRARSLGGNVNLGGSGG